MARQYREPPERDVRFPTRRRRFPDSRFLGGRDRCGRGSAARGERRRGRRRCRRLDRAGHEAQVAASSGSTAATAGPGRCPPRRGRSARPDRPRLPRARRCCANGSCPGVNVAALTPPHSRASGIACARSADKRRGASRLKAGTKAASRGEMVPALRSERRTTLIHDRALQSTELR